MTCIFCKSRIDEDSNYCDQCGKEVLVCSLCGEQGEKKWCSKDGKKLIPIKEYRKLNVSKPTIDPKQDVQVKDNSTYTKPDDKVLKLENSQLSEPLTIMSTTIIGRSTGDLIHIFSDKMTVSGNHATIEKRSTGWFLIDLGSTNGTFINSKKLMPNKDNILLNGDYIKFADIGFNVTIS